MLVPGARIHEVLHVLRELLVDVDHQGVLLLGIEVGGLVERRVESDAIGVLVMHHLRTAPQQFVLLRIGVADLRSSLKLPSVVTRSGNSEKSCSVSR